MSHTQTSVSDYLNNGLELEHPHRDKRWLYEQYWGNDLAISEVAERAGVSFTAVQRWMDKLGVVRRAGGGVDAYLFKLTMAHDELYHEYYELKDSFYKIADKYNVSVALVESQMDKYGIERRSMADAAKLRVPYCPIKYDGRGYVNWTSKLNGKPKQMAVHRLAAIAEYGIDAVKGAHVHHANGIKWLNVPVFDMGIPELENPNLVPVDGVAHNRNHH